MTITFASHLQSLEPGSAAYVEAQAALVSTDTLLAYSQAHGLELTQDDADAIIAAGSTLADGDLGNVSGGVDAGRFERPGVQLDVGPDNFLKGR